MVVIVSFTQMHNDYLDFREEAYDDSVWRVMQKTETGEEFNVFQGTEDECCNWIDANQDQFPESTFNLEEVSC